MANTAAVPAGLEPSSEELATAILEALAAVRAAPVGELREEMAAAGGNLEIDSREAEAVIAMLEKRYSRTLATVDHWATSMLSDFVIDLAFLGANGISRTHGLTTPDPAVAAVKSAALRAARRRIFIGAHVKFSAVSFVRFAEASDFETLITDTGLSLSEAHRYTELGPSVIRV